MTDRVDLNCDMGEIPELIANGTQEALMPFLTSVNIACGGHAGDDATMRATIEQARRWNVAVGAHPGRQASRREEHALCFRIERGGHDLSGPTRLEQRGDLAGPAQRPDPTGHVARPEHDKHASRQE